MADMLEGPLSSIALCWRIERPDGAGLALTSHDGPLVVDGTRFEAAPGMLPAAVQRRSGLEADSGDIVGAISSASLEEDDLLLGRWNLARVTSFAVDWREADQGQISLTQGRLGEVRIEQGEFKAELMGSAAMLGAAICPETSPECRAELGDKACRVDLAGRSVQATIVDVDGPSLVLDQSIDDQFLWGRARFVSGANCGLTTVVVAVDGNCIRLRDSRRAATGAGDRLELRHGCDKSFSTCAGRFDNAANFRGEPHLPGNDLLTRYPGA